MYVIFKLFLVQTCETPIAHYKYQNKTDFVWKVNPVMNNICQETVT